MKDDVHVTGSGNLEVLHAMVWTSGSPSTILDTASVAINTVARIVVCVLASKQDDNQEDNRHDPLI